MGCGGGVALELLGTVASKTERQTGLEREVPFASLNFPADSRHTPSPQPTPITTVHSNGRLGPVLNSPNTTTTTTTTAGITANITISFHSHVATTLVLLASSLLSTTFVRPSVCPSLSLSPPDRTHRRSPGPAPAVPGTDRGRLVDQPGCRDGGCTGTVSAQESTPVFPT